MRVSRGAEIGNVRVMVGSECVDASSSGSVVVRGGQVPIMVRMSFP